MIKRADVDRNEAYLKSLFEKHIPPLQVRVNRPNQFEVAGTIPAMQGKQKVDGYYFATVMLKPKDVRLYFFPIYTHKEAFQLSDQLQKFLKGKSCFHVKFLTDELEQEIAGMIDHGVSLYQQEGLI